MATRDPMPPGRRPARDRAWLATVLLAGLAIALAVVAEAWSENPFARAPVNDARVYWEWAGRLARGELVGDTPYLSAPLYPHLVALVRAAGGGLLALYVVQASMHVATAALLARIAARLVSPAVALGAAALWLLLADPAFAVARVVNSTLQGFTVALAWLAALRFAESRGARRAVELGLALGLAVLANPVMLAVVPLAAAWAAALDRWTRPGLARAGALAAAALLAVAPATVHNALACGELIPVSAQGGVTFFHGNAPGAEGVYHPIPGISAERIKQNVDARALAAAETDGSWRATSGAFLRRGLAYWRGRPGGALALAGRKLAWFLFGRNYGDLYLAPLEREDGFADRLALAPVASPWILLPALAFLALRARAKPRPWIEALLLLAPLATVVVFWYSPRYRFPALPVAAVLAAAAGAELVSRARAGGLGARGAVLAAAFAAGLAGGPAARALGFDDPERWRAAYERSLGTVLVELGRLDEARERYARALALGDPEARAMLGDLERRRGDAARSLELLREAARAAPGSAYARRSLAVALAEAGDLDGARAEFEAAIALDPRDWESIAGLGNLRLARGDVEGAIARYREALALHQGFAAARANLGLALARAGDAADAERELEAALALDPRLAPARAGLAASRAARGDFAGAVAVLRAGLADRNGPLAPDEASNGRSLAWLLATAPDEAARDPREAERVARELLAADGEDAAALDALAAALAAQGRFDEAAREAARAADLFRSFGAPGELVAGVEERAALYRSSRAYVQPPP